MILLLIGLTSKLIQAQKKNNKGEIIYQELDWSDYNPSIGDEWTDQPGMIWITFSSAALGDSEDISNYKFYLNNWDFDMGKYRGIVKGEPEEWKFGTGDVSLDKMPLVCDETDNIITID